MFFLGGGGEMGGKGGGWCLWVCVFWERAASFCFLACVFFWGMGFWFVVFGDELFVVLKTSCLWFSSFSFGLSLLFCFLYWRLQHESECTHPKTTCTMYHFQLNVFIVLIYLFFISIYLSYSLYISIKFDAIGKTLINTSYIARLIIYTYIKCLIYTLVEQ